MKKNRLLELAGIEGHDENPKDILSMDVPLFIRLLEWAKEDAQTDMQLHKVAENLVAMSAEGKTLSMEEYEAALKGTEAPPPEQKDMNTKQQDNQEVTPQLK